MKYVSKLHYNTNRCNKKEKINVRNLHSSCDADI